MHSEKPSNSWRSFTPLLRAAISFGDAVVERANQQPGFGFPARLRVKHARDFSAVFSRGSVVADSVLVMHVLPNIGRPTRLGLTIAKKVGNAPTRNRWKRLIREAFRLNYAKLPSGLTLVIRPRKGARPDFHQIEAALVRLCRRAARKS